MPVQGIAIDGDLSDWPANLHRYPIELTEYGHTPANASDLQADFRAAYDTDTNSLFIAVEVDDESAVTDTTGVVIWNTNDGCEIIVDAGHGEPGSTPVQFYIYGDRTSLAAHETDPGVAQIAWKRGPGYHHYEWRVDLSALTQGRFTTRPDVALGLDVVVADKDADDSYSWISWGKNVATTFTLILPMERGRDTVHS